MEQTTHSPRWIGRTALLLFCWATGAYAIDAGRDLAKVGTPRGWCVVLGESAGEAAVALARASELRVYVQVSDAKQANQARALADSASLSGTRVFVQHDARAQLHLADDLANAVIVRGKATFPREELLRVLRPGGKLVLADGETVKPYPPGIDDWSHPYHGPDNNPQSRDSMARAPYLTHFTAEPWYCPMPLVTVAAGGRLFKAFGHVAIKEREWPLLNTLIAQDAFNGTLLWKRPLSEGYMIHRNTLIAARDTVYVADDRSCKLIDATSGEQRDEILVPAGLSDGPSWKWMALADGTLYALVGATEEPDPTLKGGIQKRGWPWGPALGQGYNSKTYPWGFGTTLMALDPATKELRWSYRSDAPLDSRGTCLAAGRLFFHSAGKTVGALDARDGRLRWLSSDARLLSAIGAQRRAQNPREGFSSSCFVKANERAVYFAGPTRSNLVAVSAEDGKLLWLAAGQGNSQLVLRDDGVYALGIQDTTLYDGDSGRVLRRLGPRVNCTRATGSADSLFVRGGRDGTMRYEIGTEKAQHLCPMRPSCQDGVLPAYGHLYWGPWMCDCNLTLVGVVSLEPAGKFDFNPIVDERDRLETDDSAGKIADWPVDSKDWPALRANNSRTAFSAVAVSASPRLRWTYSADTPTTATAAIAANGCVFVGGADGAVRALDAASGKLRWTAHTGATINYPPALWQGRLFVGSGDGWLYALEAGTGRQLWRFRAAPVERMIPVYGSLRSTWPVASGVLVDNGVVYAAAGIANQDGTHVYALDAVSGKLRWHSGTSGALNPETGAGVSVNGHLLLHGNRLHLAGGNMVPVAGYDLDSGKCISETTAPPSHTIFCAGSDLFVSGDQVVAGGFPLYPAPFGDYRVAGQIILQTPAGRIAATLGPHDGKISLESADATPAAPKSRWQQSAVSRPYGLAVTPGAVIAVGTYDPPKSGQPATGLVLALSLEDGAVLWKHALPALPVPWGVAIDRAGHVLVSLQNGKTLCYE